MQYLNDIHGNALGVFLSLEEWQTIQNTLNDTRETWMREAIGRGLADMKAGRFVSEERIKGKFAALGVDVQT